MAKSLSEKIWRRGQISFCDYITGLFDGFIEHYHLELTFNPDLEEGKFLGEDLRNDITFAVMKKLDEIREQEMSPETAISKSATVQVVTREFISAFKDALKKGYCRQTVTEEMYSDLQEKIYRLISDMVFE